MCHVRRTQATQSLSSGSFRERCSEYIKELEETLKQHETSLLNLQAKYRYASDECTMLRYNIDLPFEIPPMTDLFHCGPTFSEYQAAGIPTAQNTIHSTTVESCPKSLSDGDFSCPTYQNQNVTQEAIDLPFHDKQKIGVTGPDCAGGAFPSPQCLSSFDSHFKQLGN
jgi:hypothetical protein